MKEADLMAGKRPCKICADTRGRRSGLGDWSPHATAERGLKTRSFD
jgi:hypothetical protein